MLQELRVGEQRYRAVWEVLEGASVVEVARRFGVSRQSVHSCFRRYAADGGLGGLGDRSSRPHGCPHQMSPATKARIVEIRRAHPVWGADADRRSIDPPIEVDMAMGSPNGGLDWWVKERQQ